MQKIKIAFIKYGGLGAGGTERWLQNVAAKIDKSKFDIDYFYTGDENPARMQFMQEHSVNLIKIKASGKVSDWGEWIDTDLFEKFDENQYDLIQTAIAGEKEWPFYLLKKPVIHSIHLDYGADLSDNVYHQFFLSEWMQKKNVRMGGIKMLSSIVPMGIEMPHSAENMRKELNIPTDAIVAGFHQRVDDNTFSDIPLEAFAKMQNDNRYFIIMGGSSKYSEQAQRLGLKNFIHLPHSADKKTISKFLNTLDIFAHGRKDGETFGMVFAEALLHHCPCLGHQTPTSNAHKETMGPGGLFAKNLKDYTRKLQQLFEGRQLRNKLSDDGFAFAKQKFIDKDYIKDIEKVYLAICKNLPAYTRKVRFFQALRKLKRAVVLYKKEKLGNKRKYTILGIKFSIKKK